MRRLLSIFFSSAALIVFVVTGAQAQNFKGKTIEVIVPAAAGGGFTRTAQAVTKNFAKYIPGNPKIVIKNVVGGGGQRGINQIYKSRRADGRQILFGALNMTGLALGLPGIEYDPAKFKILGIAGGEPFVTIVRKDIKGGIDKREDIVTKSGFNVGARIPGGAMGLFARAPFDMLGIENRLIVGYKNQPRMKAGLMQNELQAITTGNPGYFAFYLNDTLKKGQGIALFQHPSYDFDKGEFRTFDHIKGVPRFIDFYRSVKGEDPSGPAWEAYKWLATYHIYGAWMVMNPKTPDDIYNIMAKAWDENWKDPETLSFFMKKGKVLPVVLNKDQATRLTQTFRSALTDSALKWFQAELGIAKSATRGKGKDKKK